MADKAELQPDLSLLEPAVSFSALFDSASLRDWREAEHTLQDRRFVKGLLGQAYQEGADRIDCYRSGEIEFHDLPVSGALGMLDADEEPVIYGKAAARDKETDRLVGHCEPQLLDLITDLDVDPQMLTLGVGLEPCLTCLDRIDASGIGRVVFGATRAQVELMELVKYHDVKALDYVNSGREQGRFQQLDIFQFPEPAVAAAFAELFLPFSRDQWTEETALTDHSFAESSRFHVFRRDLTAEIVAMQTDEVPQFQGTEFDLVLEHFERTLAGFYR